MKASQHYHAAAIPIQKRFHVQRNIAFRLGVTAVLSVLALSASAADGDRGKEVIMHALPWNAIAWASGCVGLVTVCMLDSHFGPRLVKTMKWVTIGAAVVCVVSIIFA